MGAIFGDTKGSIYSFDNKKEMIKVNGSFYSFMQRYQRVLTYLANYHLALFLEKFNEHGNTEGMLLKVENISKRSSLDPFYQVLSSFYDNSCFYCGKPIKSRNKAHVDHFIPWSFVQTDQLWNLVIACSPCNLSKNDKLPRKHFIEHLVERNRKLLVIGDIRNREDMKVYRPDKVIELYNYSKENGFTDIWVPKCAK
ncbi:MAG: HNH endonuclease [Bacillaceae bacterium]|nr:HNH endonuclease [Bacillaceae bacterium]